MIQKLKIPSVLLCLNLFLISSCSKSVSETSKDSTNLKTQKEEKLEEAMVSQAIAAPIEEKELEYSERVEEPTEKSITQVSKRGPYKAYIQNLKLNTTRENKPAQLFQAIHTKFPKFWDGTTWDFNGMSTNPGKGQIACGYYVSTTLRDLGFPVKRIWLAQQAAAVVVEQVCAEEKRFTSQQDLYDYVNAQPDSSVYIVGLDFHVGYLTKEKDDEIYFIHSNYIGNEGVIKELAKESMAFANSNLYVLGSLSKNANLLAQWKLTP
jgi:hypothetical protein